ncbi:MAG: RES family NAD+ phosphorylase [Chitinophagaceae bacterium]|jgi:RES domain-containing protein|nr:RES family NAD+ phosphorylase [Chitinophagaceae bacterium]
MEVYRITQEKYADDLSGNGARLFGGRWNSEDFFMIYSASSRSLALLEILAHAPAKILQEKTYLLITLKVPVTIAPLQIEVSKLPIGWDAPDIRLFTQKTGDKFLMEQNNLLLSVPSVIMPEEHNLLINPLHLKMKEVKIIHKRKIYFDKRISENI